MPLFATVFALSVQRHMNIFDVADTCNVDHLDYNVDPLSKPLLHEVVTQLKNTAPSAWSLIVEKGIRLSV